MSPAQVPPGKVLVLRTCTAALRSPDARACGFTWPAEGPVEALDFRPSKTCGFGLHGLLWGEGSHEYLLWTADAKWLVVEVDAEDVIDLGDKVKFRKGVVVHCGDRLSATTYLGERAPGRRIVGGTATAGDRGTATAGDRGTATAGYGGTATAGECGTATAGDRGTATAGYGGTATAGECGVISLAWWDGKRRRVALFYVGENGIEPNAPYRLDDKGRPVRVEVTKGASK